MVFAGSRSLAHSSNTVLIIMCYIENVYKEGHTVRE